MVGCVIKAEPEERKFLYHNGESDDDHPVWMVNRVDILQPENFTHFHSITTTGLDPGATMVPEACDKNNADQLDNLAPTAGDNFCLGWFMEIKAIRKFSFDHGGEIVPVRSGIDNATHLNIVTNYAEVSDITLTR